MFTFRSALKFDLFAEASRKIDANGDPLQVIALHIDFAQLATLVDAFIQRSDARKGGRPVYLTEVMVHVLVPASDQRIGREDCQQLNESESPDWSEARSRQKDVDATHTRKHGKSYFGYKLSVSVDNKHGFIRRVATGTASEHDSHHFDAVLDTNNTGKQVRADKAYGSRQRQEMLGTLGFKDEIQRKAKAGKPLSECQQRRNQRIARKRAKVEHAVEGIRHMGGKFIRTIGQVRATATMTLMAACYNLKRLASFLDRALDPFFNPKPSKRQARPAGTPEPDATIWARH